MLGKVLIYLTVLFGAISTVLFILANKKERENLKKIATISFYAMVVTTVSSSIYLLANIMAHNFQFTYIWEYSSTELHDYFLFASFYSGQQGSFLLWLLIFSILGLFVIARTKNQDHQALTMGIYSSIMLFIALILIFKSPFDYVWDTFSAENLAVGYTPPNGRGLNPILQNYWITIHPPILFLGYTLMAIPYTFALSGLIRKEYKGWVDAVMPWTLVGTGILGLGIMMGGYWAYETLGWGGFWAWDPVENSSLIPWMIAVAFVHTLIIQKRTNTLIKTNFVLGLLTFIFVVYATFLTRSGVLGDTSVHSFVTPGALVYNLLIAFQIIYLGLGIGFLVFRIKDINSHTGKKGMTVSTREYVMSLGNIVLLALAAVVIIGTSWPAFAELFGQEKVSVDIQNYNKFGSVFAVIFLLLNGISLYLRWISGKFSDILIRLILPVGVSVVAVVVFYLMGLDDVTFILLSFATIFAFVTNLEFLVTNVTKNPKLIGSYISHLGLALLVLGALVSGVYSVTEQVRVKKNETKTALGYSFTFTDYKRIETEFNDREKYLYNVKIQKNGDVGIASPIVYWSDFNERQSPFLEPGIYHKLDKDIYLSPKAIEQEVDIPKLSLKKEESGDNPIDGKFKVSILTFIMDKNAAFMGEKVVLNTVVGYDFGDGTLKRDTLNSLLDANTWEAEPMWKKIEGSDIEIAMTKLIRDTENIQNTRAVISFKDSNKPAPEPVDVFTFDVTLKPFINFVWIGTLAIVAGFFVALSRYSKSYKKNITE